MNFGEELKRIRESKGMTVNQLAIYSGVSAPSISRYESGERKTPKPPTIEKLAKGLKMDYIELMKIAGHLGEQPQDKHPAEKLRDYIDQGLTDEQIKERMDFFADILKLDDNQIKEFMSWVRWQLDTKKKQTTGTSSRPEEQ